MLTRCSPGTLALVIAEHPGCEGNIGRVVEVRGPLESDEGRPCWHIQPTQGAPWLILERDGTVSGERVTWSSGVIHPDAWLTPLRDGGALPDTGGSETRYPDQTVPAGPAR